MASQRYQSSYYRIDLSQCSNIQDSSSWHKQHCT